MNEPTSVVIVNWNNSALTLRAVRSVLHQRTSRPVAIVVVDNGSTDSERRPLENRPEFQLVTLAENRGFGAGANAGIANTSTPHVILLNNDAVADENFVEEILSRPRRGTNRGATDRIGAVTAHILLSGRYTRDRVDAVPSSVGTPLLGLDGQRWYRAAEGRGVTVTNSTGNVITRSGNGRDRHWLFPAPVEAGERVFGFSGGAVALDRTAFDEAGGFDESLFMYYEDTELSWRLRRAGWEVVHRSTALVRHDHAASSGTGSSMFLRYNARNRLLVAIWHGPVSMAVLAGVATLARLVRLAGAGRRNEFRAVWQATREVAQTLGSQLRKRRALNERFALRAEAVRDGLTT